MDNQKLISVPDLFKKSFALYKPRVWTMLFLGLIGWLGSIIVFGLFGTASVATLVFGRGFLALNLFTALLFLTGFLLVIIINVWVQVALIHAVKKENVTMGVKSLLIAVKDKMPSSYWIVFLRGVVVLMGFIIFIIPGVIFVIWFNFSQYVFVIDGIKGQKALGRSKELVKGYWWPVFGRVLLFMAIAIFISSFSSLGFLINSLFIMPLGIIYVYVIYEDLKRVKGGM